MSEREGGEKDQISKLEAVRGCQKVKHWICCCYSIPWVPSFRLVCIKPQLKYFLFVEVIKNQFYFIFGIPITNQACSQRIGRFEPKMKTVPPPTSNMPSTPSPLNNLIHTILQDSELNGKIIKGNKRKFEKERKEQDEEERKTKCTRKVKTARGSKNQCFGSGSGRIRIIWSDPYQETLIWIRVAPKINQNHGINKSKWFVNVLFT